MFTAEVLPTQLHADFDISAASPRLRSATSSLDLDVQNSQPWRNNCKERRNYEHDSVDYPNPPVNWGVTGLAI
jgi:hypothetical protein